MSQCYNREGEPISHEEWARMFEDHEYQVVKQDTLDNGIFVSTVWLGLNHAFGGGPHRIFETMVFGGQEELQNRYATLSDAESGHQAMIEQVSGWAPTIEKLMSIKEIS